jgi:hypothetical protein
MKFSNVEFKQEVLGRTNRLLSFDTTRDHVEDEKSKNSSIVAAVTFLRSRCLATIVGYKCRQTDGRDLLSIPLR